MVNYPNLRQHSRHAVKIPDNKKKKKKETYQPVVDLEGPVRERDELVREALAHDRVVELVPLPGAARRVGRGGRAGAAGRVLLADLLGLEPASAQRGGVVVALLELAALGGARAGDFVVEGASRLVGAGAWIWAAPVEVVSVLEDGLEVTSHECEVSRGQRRTYQAWPEDPIRSRGSYPWSARKQVSPSVPLDHCCVENLPCTSS